jgi:catechol 2,3-dioxygenase-like lactoylglutathione lyase family enzyme
MNVFIRVAAPWPSSWGRESTISTIRERRSLGDHLWPTPIQRRHKRSKKGSATRCCHLMREQRSPALEQNLESRTMLEHAYRRARRYRVRVPVLNVSHIAIGVRQMDDVLPFWTEVVGLHVSLDSIEEFTVGGEVIRRRGVYLRETEGPDEPFVVLDQQLTRAPAGSPKPLFERGVHHVGFWVDDLDEVWGRAIEAGITIVSEPTATGSDTANFGEPPGGSVRGMIVRDPEGNAIQFDERVG